MKVITVDTDNFLKLHVYCNFTSMTHRMTCFVMVHTLWKIMKLTEWLYRENAYDLVIHQESLAITLDDVLKSK